MWINDIINEENEEVSRNECLEILQKFANNEHSVVNIKETPVDDEINA
jgi:hypothetical protein